MVLRVLVLVHILASLEITYKRGVVLQCVVYCILGPTRKAIGITRISITVSMVLFMVFSAGDLTPLPPKPGQRHQEYDKKAKHISMALFRICRKICGLKRWKGFVGWIE